MFFCANTTRTTAKNKEMTTPPRTQKPTCFYKFHKGCLLLLLFLGVSLLQSIDYSQDTDDDAAPCSMMHSVNAPMHSAAAPATMPRHKIQRHGTKHNAPAQKQKCGSTNSSATAKIKLWHAAHAAQPAPHRTTAAHGAMPWHIAQCCGTKNSATARSTMPWHKKNCGKLCNAAAHRAMPCHKKICHGTNHNAAAQKAAHHAMPQHIGTKNSTWCNAAAHCAMPWHKPQMPWHQSHCCGTKHNTVAQKQPSSTKNSAAGRMPQCNAIPPTQQSKSLHRNITTTKAKMTMTPLWWPTPHRLIVSPPQKNPC